MGRFVRLQSFLKHDDTSILSIPTTSHACIYCVARACFCKVTTTRQLVKCRCERFRSWQLATFNSINSMLQVKMFPRIDVWNDDDETDRHMTDADKQMDRQTDRQSIKRVRTSAVPAYTDYLWRNHLTKSGHQTLMT